MGVRRLPRRMGLTDTRSLVAAFTARVEALEQALGAHGQALDQLSTSVGQAQSQAQAASTSASSAASKADAATATANSAATTAASAVAGVGQLNTKVGQVASGLTVVQNDLATTIASLTAQGTAIASIQTTLAVLQDQVNAVSKKKLWLDWQVIPVTQVLVLNGTVDVPVTWSTPAPNVAYDAKPKVLGAVSLLSNVEVAEKVGTKNTAGITFTVKNKGVLLSANTASIAALAFYFG